MSFFINVQPFLKFSLSVLFSLPELSDSVSLSPADRMQALCLKLALLGKAYAGTPRYFPLGKLLACIVNKHMCLMAGCQLLF